jgi:hypothetical protein
LRIIGPDAIGHDVNIPPLAISYRIHSRVGAAATLEGRDLSYLLPMMPIKVLSLVPNDASDIRDGSEASLGAVESLRFRSSLFRVLTIAFGALAAVVIVLALVPLARSRAVVTTAERDRAPDRAVLYRVAEDLVDVQKRLAGDGWTDDTVARTLALMRVIAAAAIDHPISQRVIPAGGVVPEGRLLVRHGLITSSNVAVASPVTADDVARAAARSTAFSTTRRQQLDELQSALAALTLALYRKEAVRDAATLDDAVRQGIGIARDIARERSSWSHRWARR